MDCDRNQHLQGLDDSKTWPFLQEPQSVGKQGRRNLNRDINPTQGSDTGEATTSSWTLGTQVSCPLLFLWSVLCLFTVEFLKVSEKVPRVALGEKGLPPSLKHLPTDFPSPCRALQRSCSPSPPPGELASCRKAAPFINPGRGLPLKMSPKILGNC